MEYNFKEIEKKWQAYWAANHTFKAEIDNSKPKYSIILVAIASLFSQANF